MSHSHKLSFGDMAFHLSATGDGATTGKPVPGAPFRVAIMGDFSGRSNQGMRQPLKGASGASASSRRPIKIDCDNFDQVMAELGPQLQLPIGDQEGSSISIKFKEIDDFHPDELFVKVDLFDALRRTRQRLMDPSTFDQAAAEVRRWSHMGRTTGVDSPLSSDQPTDNTDTAGGRGGRRRYCRRSHFRGRGGGRCLRGCWVDPRVSPTPLPLRRGLGRVSSR